MGGAGWLFLEMEASFASQRLPLLKPNKWRGIPSAPPPRPNMRKSHAKASPNVMDFFKDMDRGMEEQGQALKAEADDIHDRLRMHRRTKRSKSSSRLPSGGLPRDSLRDARN